MGLEIRDRKKTFYSRLPHQRFFTPGNLLILVHVRANLREKIIEVAGNRAHTVQLYANTATDYHVLQKNVQIVIGGIHKGRSVDLKGNIPLIRDKNELYPMLQTSSRQHFKQAISVLDITDLFNVLTHMNAGTCIGDPRYIGVVDLPEVSLDVLWACNYPLDYAVALSRLVSDAVSELTPGIWSHVCLKRPKETSDIRRCNKRKVSWSYTQNSIESTLPIIANSTQLFTGINNCPSRAIGMKLLTSSYSRKGGIVLVVC
ncbi:hypothetical protein J6590_009704 [Homalodisca vitripennis]|nr:hypothetical protein J6590_009704 [Homalodisca vitripennis]